jgi:hypothetical protein
MTATILSFKPRPQDREVRAVLPPATDVLPDNISHHLDNLLQGSPYNPPLVRRPRGTLMLELQGSFTKFIMKVVVRHTTGKHVSTHPTAKGEFISRFLEWSLDSRINVPTGYYEFKVLYGVLIKRGWEPTTIFEPQSGLGIIFGFQKGEYTTLIMQVEYGQEAP